MSNKLYKVRPGKPAVKPIDAVKNDTFLYKITGYNKDGTPYDFTGHTFLMQVKKQGANDTDDALIDITNTSFTVTQDANGAAAGVNNVIEIEHDDESMNIDAGCYQYDIQMTDAADKDQTIQKGDFILSQDTSE